MGAVLRYLGANLVFLNFLAPNLPGMFQENPLQAVNGALWTLKIEVAFYCILPLIAFFARKLGPAKWLLFAMLYAAAEIWRIQFREAGGGLAILAHQLPGQLNYFVTGMALWELRGLYTPRLFAGALGFAIVAASYLYPAMESARAAALGALVIACASAPRVGSAGPFRGDISYGVYIVHFPIIQAIHSAAGGNLNLGIQAAFSAAAILASAVLLWNYVERPCLHAGSHYKSQRTRSPLTS
jgi:peptidoglycan/LPS O-acetylase OafA/YrhL